MYILGLNAFHADAAAVLIKDGVLLEGIEEERLSRKKHHFGFPFQSIEHCLSSNNLKASDIDIVSISTKPSANLKSKIIYSLLNPSITRITGFLSRRKRKLNIRDILIENGFSKKVKVEFKEHHLCHIFSGMAGFKDSAAILTVDGFGDFLSAKSGFINKNKIFSELFSVPYPHSLGIFYQSMTQFLGFKRYGDEYKIMGLAPYGVPKYYSQLSKLIKLTNDGFRLDLKYFVHHKKNVERVDDFIPVYEDLFSNLLESEFPNIIRDGKGTHQTSMDFAASVQKVYESTFVHLLELLKKKYPDEANLILAGGCANNSVANGKIKQLGFYKNVFVPASAGDAGCAIGAGILSSTDSLDLNSFYTPYLANTLNEDELLEIIKISNDKNYIIHKVEDPEKKLAEMIYGGFVVGRCVGKMEWGPRALGNRSILGNPSDPKIREKINAKIKFRELFRPFAPSFLRKEVNNWLEVDDNVPYMMKVYKVKHDKRDLIGAVTHVDGTARVQTVTESSNKRYHKLIQHFYKLNGTPCVLNTSLNENEPIVASYKQAFAVFERTDMDAIQLDNIIIARYDI